MSVFGNLRAPSVHDDAMDRIVCTISGYICLDGDGVRQHVEALRKLFPTLLTPAVYRCPGAAAHPSRPYHVGRRRNLHRPSQRAA